MLVPARPQNLVFWIRGVYKNVFSQAFKNGTQTTPQNLQFGVLLAPTFAKSASKKGAQKTIKNTTQKSTKKGPKKGPKMDPKTIQNRHQILRRNKMLSKTLLEPSWADLRPSWAPPRVQKVENSLENVVFREKSLFLKNRVPRAVLDPTWANLGAQEGPNGTPKGAQNGTKNRSKKWSKFDAIFDRFWSQNGAQGTLKSEAWEGFPKQSVILRII